MNVAEPCRGQASGSEWLGQRLHLLSAEKAGHHRPTAPPELVLGIDGPGSGTRADQAQAATLLGGTEGLGKEPRWAGPQRPSALLQRRAAGQGASSPLSLDSGAWSSWLAALGPLPGRALPFKASELREEQLHRRSGLESPVRVGQGCRLY